MKNLTPNLSAFPALNTPTATSPREDFIRINRNSEWGVLDIENKYASLNTLQMAIEFRELYPDWTVEFMWDNRVVSFFPTNDKTGTKGQVIITKTISRTFDGKELRTKRTKYTLSESSYNRLRRFWGMTKNRSLGYSHPFVYEFVW